MVDVIHVFYEEDLIPKFEQHAEIKSQVRTILYRELYDKEYEYRIKTPGQRFSVENDPAAFDLPPDTEKTKPFIPATNPEDLPGILEAPLGE
jgi:hypothetical protein